MDDRFSIQFLAAIRIARGGFARYGLSDAAKKEYLEIESKMSLDELDKISSTNSWGYLEIGKDFYAFDVWWIDLRIKRHGIKDDFGRTPSHFNVRIRENAVSSRKLTEEEAKTHREHLERARMDLERKRFERDRSKAKNR